MKWFCWIGAILFLAMAACHRPLETLCTPSLPELVAIDSLMQNRPDSALALLQASPKDDPYYQLLLSEALYKNDSAQLNRPMLLEALAYYDSLDWPFLSARCHYMNGVGYYEMDSVVEACEEYLKALEIMEEHYKEKDLVGYKAKFMALIYTHLCGLFSDQYLHVQAIFFAKKSYAYSLYTEFNSFQSAWALNKVGLNYDMMEKWDSAAYYYHRAAIVLDDTNNLIYRDISSHLAMVDYKMGIGFEKPIARLRNLLLQANTDNEFIARCLAMGELFYHEKILDSAEFYSKKVYWGSDNISSKKQTAEWLVEILRDKGEHVEAQRYADYLVPFANLAENQSIIKSQLVDVFQEYGQNKIAHLNNKYTRKNQKRTAAIITGLFLLSMLFVALVYFLKTQQLKNERHKHKMKQAALAGRLKRSNASLKKEKESRLETSIYDNTKHSTITGLVDEPICQHILSVCNDKKNPIKSNISPSAYSSIALTQKQQLQLKEAINRHYGWLFEKLIISYPDLKEKDLEYCYLCLLGLNNTQIAVLLQKTTSTIWEREKRLQKIFGMKKSISVILNGFMIS